MIRAATELVDFGQPGIPRRADLPSHEVISSVEKRPPDGQTYVLINEVPSCDWGNAGTVYAPRP